jgi:hypothetical protein
VYLITNLKTNKKYVGKKLFKFRKSRQPLKGRRNKRRQLVDSDWLTYFGSNKPLMADVEKHGAQNFRREILRLCKTKSECTYYECKYQYQYDVLLKPDEWYNSWIICKVSGKNL